MGKNRFSVKKISFLGGYLSLILILSFVPYTGYIYIWAAPITTIPIIIAMATVHLGLSGAITTGLGFGIGSFWMSVVFGDPVMGDPVISIVPRFLLGLTIFAIYKVLGKINLWKFTLLAASTIIFNTLYVSAFIFLAKSWNPALYKLTFYFFLGAVYINFFIELGVAILLALPLYRLVIYESKKMKNIPGWK